MLQNSLKDLIKFMDSDTVYGLTELQKSRITKCREYLEGKISEGGDPIYGINTGFGALCDTIIPANELEILQKNLLLSHACGMGEEVPTEIVRWMLFLKIRALALGHSGVRLETVERLLEFFNIDLIPVVYQQGSLGASGDLAPLAHLSLPLIGEGEVYYKEERMSAKEALSLAKLEPLTLHSKEGLALINGTQFMSAYACHLLSQLEHLFHAGNIIAAMSIEAFMARTDPFEPFTHSVRKHAGQGLVADAILTFLDNSEMQRLKREVVQDPYSFRCIPQVHGASRDAFDYVSSVVETEINSVTDNPIIFPLEDRIISGGNFHGQPLALCFDLLAIAIAELGSISERRTYKLISGQRGLPPFLTKNPGLNSGLMISQYTAASIVSQNKQLCTPCSVDTIDSSNGQEDHVSMGANGATRCFRVMENLKTILSIELLTAAQAFEFRRPLKSSKTIESLFVELRRSVPFIEEDVYLKKAMDKSRKVVDRMRIRVTNVSR